MKRLFFLLLPVLVVPAAVAQDVNILKTGENINGKVSKVGINEIKYYKTTNPTGPVYVSSKADVTQVLYTNGGKDVFGVAQTNASATNVVVVSQVVPQTVVIEQPVRRYRYYNPLPVIVRHIDFGHHLDIGFRSHSHHNRHH